MHCQFHLIQSNYIEKRSTGLFIGLCQSFCCLRNFQGWFSNLYVQVWQNHNFTGAILIHTFDKKIPFASSSCTDRYICSDRKIQNRLTQVPTNFYVLLLAWVIIKKIAFITTLLWNVIRQICVKFRFFKTSSVVGDISDVVTLYPVQEVYLCNSIFRFGILTLYIMQFSSEFYSRIFQVCNKILNWYELNGK